MSTEKCKTNFRYWLEGLWLVSILIMLTACTYTLPVQSSDALAAPAGSLKGLVGAWVVETTVVEQNAIFPALLTFTSDGLVFGDEPPAPFETTAHGNWVTTGPQSAAFTFLALIGSEAGPLAATIKVAGTLQYDAKADTWNGPFQVQVVDADGNELLVDNGTFDATRIAIETLDVEAESNSILAVFDAFHVAVNAHDVEAALLLFADDALAQFPNQPPPNEYKGPSEIRTWLEQDVADNIHVSTDNIQVDGETVTAISQVNVDSVPPEITLEGLVEIRVQQGKITSFTYTLSEKTLEELMSTEENKPILAVFDPAADTPEEYDQITQALEAAGAGSPPGRLYHLGYAKEDGVIVVVDVWESSELLGQFAETLVPILHELGLTPTEPQIYPVHNIIQGEAVAGGAGQ